MPTIKPPYKFKSPYRANDTLGKQGAGYRFRIIDFSKNPAEITELTNSEKNYYKNCTRDLSRRDLYSEATELLEIYVDKKFKAKLEKSLIEYAVTGKAII